jgi:hypothetical protein
MLALLEPGETWYYDKLIPDGTVAVWDKSAMVMIQGPIATSQYRDELGQNTGVIVRDKWKLTQMELLRITKGGHIITEDSEGNITVYCKKIYFKIGKRKWKLPPKVTHFKVTGDDVIASVCPVCSKIVQVREQLIDYSWNPGFLDSKILGVMEK